MSLPASQPSALLLFYGADEANAETLAEWVATVTIMTGDDNVLASKFGGNNFLFEEAVRPDRSVQRTAVTGDTDIVLVCRAVAAAVGEIFVI